MKKAELIKLLENVPEDAELVVVGACDDILGDYNYNESFNVTETQAYRSKYGNLSMSISNYRGKDDEKVKVWLIE